MAENYRAAGAEPTQGNCWVPVRWVAAARFPVADPRWGADLPRAAALLVLAADTLGRQRRVAAHNRVATAHRVLLRAELRLGHGEPGKRLRSAGQFVARAAQSAAVVDALR